MIQARLHLYAAWATIGGKGGQQAADHAIKALGELGKNLFPFVRQESNRQKDEKDLAVLAAVMQNMGLGNVVQEAKGQVASAPKRASVWERMMNRVLGRDEEKDA